MNKLAKVTNNYIFSIFFFFFCVLFSFSAASAQHSCLTLSADGTTVTGSNGCTVLTANDWGTATRIADGYANAYVFMNSKDTLTSVTFPATLEVIGNYAFYECANITGSLTIPDPVTSIGKSAFSGCSGLTGSLTIPDSVTTISDDAFGGCTGFTGDLIIGNSVATIGDGAYQECSGFTGSLIIGDSVTTIGSFAFNFCRGFTGNLNIPSSVTSIGSNAFYYCRNLDGILVTNKSVTVGTYAFGSAAPVYCYADSSWINDGGGTKVPFITSISVDDITMEPGDTETVTITSDQSRSNSYIPSITYSGTNDFNGPSGLNPVARLGSETTAKGVTTNTIYGIETGIRMVTVTAAQVGSDIFGTDAVPAIPSTTFYVTVTRSCLIFSEDGTTVTGTDGTCTVVAAADFKNATKIADASSSTSGVFYGSKDTLISVSFPSTLETIGNYSFNNCKNLTGNLTIPNSVTTIGQSAFYGCSRFTGSLTIPNSVTTIGNSAFSGCRSFTGNLTIGNSVTTIGNGAFGGCSGFTGSLTIPNSVTC